MFVGGSLSVSKERFKVAFPMDDLLWVGSSVGSVQFSEGFASREVILGGNDLVVVSFPAQQGVVFS